MSSRGQSVCAPCACCHTNTAGAGPKVDPWLCWECRRDIEDADANGVGAWSAYFRPEVLRYRANRNRARPETP